MKLTHNRISKIMGVLKSSLLLQAATWWEEDVDSEVSSAWRS